MTIRCLMVPHWFTIENQGESGIKTVVKKYFKYLPDCGIELVHPKEDDFDVLAIHAGMTNRIPDSAPIVAQTHGIYWTADYPFDKWQHKANRAVIESIRHASAVTVPSSWVAETLQRDMHLNPTVIGHGIDADEWAYEGVVEDYVIGYAKNRAGMDVCDPTPLATLAIQHPKLRFISTFMPANGTRNIRATGVLPQEQWKPIVQRAATYVSFVKETFCLGALEAMAAGVPVVGFAEGGITDFVRHGITGYLARPGDMADLSRGLEYCLTYRDVLGANSVAVARRFTWPRIAEKVASVYRYALTVYHEAHDVTVVIPCFNKVSTLERALKSVLQSTLRPAEIIIVDNNSTDGSLEFARRLAEQHGGDATITVVREELQGVAHARNRGCELAATRYVCCLDADDEIEPGFLEACVKTLKANTSLGVAYTRLRWVNDKDGTTSVSAWPGEYKYDEFFQRKNQVPTCCVFTKEAWRRSGGYRQRYAPHGAGAEDAELWLRLGALGFGGKLATDEPLFVYHLGGQVSGNPHYSEPDWLAGHPWVADRKHPFASLATPEELSHPVRQYDAPKISVIIPVGPSHERYLFDVLDSLEAQSFRYWEAIVVFDGWKDRDQAILKRVKEAFPFIRVEIIQDTEGAGAARNRGAEMARAPLLLFVDADDWLTPDALDILYRFQVENGGIVYSDYIGHAFISDVTELDRLKMTQRLIAHDPKTNLTKLYHNAHDYNCEEALLQPQPTRPRGQFYIWCLISSLVPKVYHEEINGFDETMPSWEDWDYWLRMARAGKCFHRATVPLVEYRFYTGTRRQSANPDESGESGRQLSGKLLQYLQTKRDEAKSMPCGGCKKQRAPVIQQPMMARSMNEGATATMSADSMVWVRLNDNNLGDHPISFAGTSYGYRAHGDRFLMQEGHAKLDHRVVIEPLPATGEPEQAEPKPLAAPEPIDEEDFAVWEEPEKGEDPFPKFQLDGVWGMNPRRKASLVDAGIFTSKQLLATDRDELGKILGLAPLTIGRMIASVERLK